MACLEGHGQNCPQLRGRENAEHYFQRRFWPARPPGSVIAQTPDAGCALPSEPLGIPAALDAAIHGARADKDRDCMKALLIPEARMIFVSLGTGGAPAYRMASELLVQVFGERGIHSRSAVSVAQVPFGACVEIDMIAEIEAT